MVRPKEVQMKRKARDRDPTRYRDEHWERRGHVPAHAAKPRALARYAGTLVTVAALILVGFVALRQYNAQVTLITLRQAAREGARLDSVGYPESNIVLEAQRAATGLGPVAVMLTPCPVGAAPHADAVVTVSYSSFSARAVMPCEA